MSKMIHEEILRTFRMEKNVGQQVKKEYLLEKVAAVCDCTPKEVQAEYLKMKKDNLVYPVSNMPGWVRLY